MSNFCDSPEHHGGSNLFKFLTSFGSLSDTKYISEHISDFRPTLEKFCGLRMRHIPEFTCNYGNHLFLPLNIFPELRSDSSFRVDILLSWILTQVSTIFQYVEYSINSTIPQYSTSKLQHIKRINLMIRILYALDHFSFQTKLNISLPERWIKKENHLKIVWKGSIDMQERLKGHHRSRYLVKKSCCCQVDWVSTSRRRCERKNTKS